MPTITGTYRRGGGTPERGWLTFTPTVAITDGEEVILPAAERVALEPDGSFEVTLEATDDTNWTPTGWVWQITERLPGGRTWHFELTDDADIGDLVPVEVPDSYLPWVFTATATTGAPGSEVDVDITGTAPAPVFEFVIPRGDKGEVGDEGPPNVLSIGTVTTEAPGDPATAVITGTSPAQVLDLGIPEGDKGDKGDQGDPGPTTDLSVGTVTTGAPGSSASAEITGTPPTLELDLTIPRGDVGGTGPANSLTIGTVTTLAPGDPATADITGTPPAQTLDLSIPRGDKGDKGDKGDTGDAGPPSELSIGTVTTGPAGSSASATITGTPPSQVLDLTIPRGDKGATGNVAPGNIGNLLSENVATGTDTLSTTEGFVVTGTGASSAEQAWQGVRSLKMTATANTSRVGVGGSNSSGNIPVVPNWTYTFLVYIRGDAGVTFTRRATIFWWTAAGNVAASTASVVGETIAVSSAGWTLYAVTGVAPANAAFGSASAMRVAGGAAGQVEFYDGFSFHVGPGGLWMPPGWPVPNLGVRANPSNSTQAQVWNPGNNTWITV